jgi:putative hemolysin
MTTLLLTSPDREAGTGVPRYTLRLAAGDEEVAAAQRLRYRVFADEVGATLRTPLPGHDIDPFDEHCDHMIVIDERTGEVVATYRLLPPGRSRIRYSDTEFDLAGLDGIRDQLVETGRSCVHPDHRAGAAINLVWAGIARYMHLYGYRYLGGCASVDVRDGGATAAAVWDRAQERHLSPQPWRVAPRRPWVPAADAGGVADGGRRPAVPPLLKGYLRLGAWICGAPAHDPEFACADFYVLLDVAGIDARYMRHFLGE